MILANMHYLAVLPDGSTKYFGNRYKAKRWADNQDAQSVKVYRTIGTWPLVAHYVRDKDRKIGYSSQPIVGGGECLKPLANPLARNTSKKELLRDEIRPAPYMLTRLELSLKTGFPGNHIDHCRGRGQLVFERVRGTIFYDSRVPVPEYRWKVDPTRWSRHFDKCQGCGTKQRKHDGNGLCWKCYRAWMKQKQLAREELDKLQSERS